MKKKFSFMWRAAVALALVASLGMVFAAPAGAQDPMPPPNTGTIIIEKETWPPGDPTTFDFYLDPTGPPAVDEPIATLGDGEQIVLDGLPAGWHLVKEVPLPGWYVDIDFEGCGHKDCITIDGHVAKIDLDPCDVVTVTFINYRDPLLVNIIECPDYDVPFSTTFVIKAEITNIAPYPKGSERRGVKACLDWEPVNGNGGSVDVLGRSCHRLGVMDPGETDTVAWTVHCDGPGDVLFKVYTECFGGYDECIVRQMLEPGFDVEIDAPCEVCVNCPPDNQFPVDVGVTNTGGCPIYDVQVIIHKTGPATIVGSASRWIAEIPAMGTVWVSSLTAGPYIYNCTGTDGVSFGVDVEGTDSCTGETIGPISSNTVSTTQTEVIVDVPCVLGLSTEINPDYVDEVPGAEKYLSACGDTCAFMPPSTAAAPNWNDTGYPVAYDIVSYDPADVNSQKFMVTTAVKNCTNTPKTFNICIQEQLTSSWEVDATEPVHIYCPKTGAEEWVPSTDCVTVTDVCGCCEVLVTWICECTAPSPIDPGYDPIRIDVNAGTWSNFDWDPSYDGCNPAGIIQVNKAHLASTVEAFVSDCTGCPTRVDTVAVSQDFDVSLCIKNTGDADAYDVMVDMSVLGLASCAGSWDDFVIGDIPGGETVCIWLSDVTGSTCHCDEEGQVEVRVDKLVGYDENTCELIPKANIDPVCPLLIKQCDIEVVIVNPEWCEEICTGDEFAVKAKFTNCGTCSFEDVKLCLSWEGDGDVEIQGKGKPRKLRCKRLPDLKGPTLTEGELWDVVPPCPACIDCMIYEVSWQVKCTKPGDVTFHVCVISDPEMCGGDWIEDEGELEPVPHFQIRDITDPLATVHQRPRPEITVEIISPENLDTFVATGQEFTVTVAIANKTDWHGHHWGRGPRPGYGGYGKWLVEEYPVTITDLGLMLHPESGAEVLVSPDVDFVISGGEIATVTWTLECNESGLQIVDAYVVAETYDCCPPFEAMSFPILLWQYPTAHLEVEIDSRTPTTVNACDEFDVLYTVTNTGEADATEVEAVLSVIPEGTARPAAGIDSGYTVDIGTLEAHGQDGVYEGTWRMHCKEACESTINITAEGFDEYGWHKKQVCQSTGNFIIEAGALYTEELDVPPDIIIVDGGPYPPAKAAQIGVFIGEASGFIGPFNLNTPISWYEFGPDEDSTGNLVAMGFVIPDMDYVEAGNHVEFLTRILPRGFNLLDLLERLNLQGVDKDVMIYVGHITMDSEYEDVPHGDVNVFAGLIQAINGRISGTSLECTRRGDDGVFSWLDGTYCSTMAQEALREIPEKFIEDACVTVKQLESGGLDLGVTKTVDDAYPEYFGTVTYTIRVTNYGPTNASGVVVTDDLWDTIVSYLSDVATQGTYDDTSGVWTIGNMTVGASATLMLLAHVGAEVEWVNTATVTCDQPDGNPANNTDSAVINPTLAINLEEGWNFVSWPLIPDYPGIETTPGVLDDLAPLLDNLESAWGNFAPVAGTWDSYDPDSITNTLLTMNDGVGFWIEMLTPGLAIVIEGQEQPDPPATPRVYPVVGGAGGYWNVIAFKSTTPKSPDDYLEGIVGQYTIIYGFDEGAYFIVGTPGHENLEPGLAYWIAVLESGNIFP